MAWFPGSGQGNGGFGHGAPFGGLFDRLLNDFFADGFREFEEMQRRMEQEIRSLQGGFEEMQTQPPAEGQQSLRKRMLVGPGEGLPHGPTGQTPRQQLLTDDNTLTMDNSTHAYYDSPQEEEKKNTEAPKNGWLTLWSNIDMDEDRPSQWDMQQPPPPQQQQQPTVQSFSSSSSTFSSGGNGTFESKRTVSDAQGNVEITVTKRTGNQETTVVTKRRADGTEERTERMVDLSTGQMVVPGPIDGAQGNSGWLAWLWGRGR
eukprot:comp23350_c0_seq2/m.38549 comp23350_c0_seq2/g.38549  ORF comp23350_c0_seq2/g.38549 comp23350_c0_seq2/m.38549 type:complete len:260 (-) comp23350_c0_seq2:597-1376(-)